MILSSDAAARANTTKQKANHRHSFINIAIDIETDS
jgi:hypothetical protein